MRRSLAALPLAVLLSMSLAGCGGENDSSSTSSSGSSSTSSASASTETKDSRVTPGSKVGLADGVLTAKGYAYAVPKSWKDETAASKKLQAVVDSTTAEPNPTDKFADNITVALIKPSPVQKASQVTAAISQQMPDAQVKDLGATTLGGQPANHLSATPKIPGQSGSYSMERYDVVRGGALYGIEFSFSKTVTAAERRAIIDPVVKSWTWR